MLQGRAGRNAVTVSLAASLLCATQTQAQERENPPQSLKSVQRLNRRWFTANLVPVPTSPWNSRLSGIGSKSKLASHRNLVLAFDGAKIRMVCGVSVRSSVHFGPYTIDGRAIRLASSDSVALKDAGMFCSASHPKCSGAPQVVTRRSVCASAVVRAAHCSANTVSWPPSAV
jgi:hypothetical protein